MRSIVSWYDKANSLAQAWAGIFGSPPSRATCALALAVAEHETACGDAWPGDHNWGACTKGALTTAQRQQLQRVDIHPILSPPARREAVEADATKALALAGCPVPDDAAIHVDSSPAAGPYFTLFGRFATDVEGAAYFVHVLAEQRSSCRAVLTSTFPVPAPWTLAEAMYRTHYFTGFHSPHEPGGDEANVSDYARALAALLPGITAALADWTPGAAAPAPAPPAVGSVLWAQVALNRCGAVPPLAEDGIDGPRTLAALQAYQERQGLPRSGRIDMATVESLGDDLARLDGLRA